MSVQKKVLQRETKMNVLLSRQEAKILIQLLNSTNTKDVHIWDMT